MNVYYFPVLRVGAPPASIGMLACDGLPLSRNAYKYFTVLEAAPSSEGRVMGQKAAQPCSLAAPRYESHASAVDRDQDGLCFSKTPAL